MTPERVIEILNKLIRGSVAALHSRSGIDALKIAIEALEQQRWIPVSDGLPEEKQRVLITTKHNEVYEAKNSYGCFELPDGWISLSNVLAWQPLPEPYEGG